MSEDTSLELTRRDVLKLGALAGAGASLAALADSTVRAAAAVPPPTPFDEATIACRRSRDTAISKAIAGR